MLPTWSCYNESKTRRLIKEPCLYCSSGAFLDTNDVSSILSRCRDLGIRNIELSSGLKSGVKKLGETLLAAKDEFNLLFMFSKLSENASEKIIINIAATICLLVKILKIK